ncbi:MAG: class I SAM-dependent methyltransferase [Chloroflexota bacterium]
MATQNYGNRQKHLNPNLFQQILLARFHRIIQRLVRQTGATRVLDAGCGEGFGLQYLQHTLSGLTLVGGDVNPEAMQWGRANVPFDAPLVNLNLHHLPFPDASFPLVICLEVLEHLPDSRIGLRELARVSSEYVLLSVPHEPWFRGANFLRGKHFRAFGNDPEHLHNYTSRAFHHMAGSVIDILWHGYTFPWQIVLGRKRA